MKRAGKLLIGVFAAILLSSFQAGAKKKVVLTTLEGGETGKIYFESTSPYNYRDILDGSDNDPKVTVFGILKLPKGTEGKVPAMVFVHGGGGFKTLDERYLRELNKMGVATFRTDSLHPRGFSSTASSQGRVSLQMGMADAFNALRLLSTHPRIDPNGVGIMGRSWGGIVARSTAWEPLRKAAMGDDLKFALHIALYPVCPEYENLSMTGAPIRILIGKADEVTPAKPLQSLVLSLQKH